MEDIGVAWVESEIDDRIEQRIAERDRRDGKEAA